ncbi:MAG: DUF4980 domain-containing protein [Bacteroidales bacterium]|nr:DUF4980 domain-containing protein [Bacteroidales bacterium]
MKRLLIALSALLICAGLSAGETDRITTEFLRPDRCLVRVKTDKKYVLLPIEEPVKYKWATDGSFLEMVVENQKVAGFWVFPALSHIDYYAPIDVSEYNGREIVFLICAPDKNTIRPENIAWKEIKCSDEFDTTNKEKYRPAFHPTSAFGWQSDPNGLFYKDGVWHAYYQHNPYGSSRGNESWGHSWSTDLVHWNWGGTVLYPDGLGRIFSGSAVVDSRDDAGFGKDAVIAFYTSDWGDETQSQSIAVSHDSGMTFKKYEGNPILTDFIYDFRDPHVFWNEDAGFWNMIIAAGPVVKIYSSTDLLNWKYESSFGEGYGSHLSTWECPNMFKIKAANGESRWVILHSANLADVPEPHSTSQYFTGSFDGHVFKCESDPKKVKALDYSPNEYALITFNNAPAGRHVALGWMSYENDFPTKQYRCCMTMPRDLELYFEKGEAYLAMKPSPEIEKARKPAVVSTKSSNGKIKDLGVGDAGDAYEVVVDFNASKDARFTVRLANKAGEFIDFSHDASFGRIVTDRRAMHLVCGEATKAGTVRGGVASQMKIFFDRSVVDVFDGKGTMSMPSLCFPDEPFTIVSTSVSRGKCSVKSLKVYPIN